MGEPSSILAPWIVWPIVIILIKLPFVLFGILSCLQDSAEQTAKQFAENASLTVSDYIDDEVSVSAFCRCIRFPISVSERQVLFRRYKANIHRFRYLTFHISIALVFYTFPYSVLTENIRVYNEVSFNIIFHFIQICAIIVYFRASLMDPGIIKASSFAKSALSTPLSETTPLISQQHSSTSVIVKTSMDYRYPFGMFVFLSLSRSTY